MVKKESAAVISCAFVILLVAIQPLPSPGGSAAPSGVFRRSTSTTHTTSSTTTQMSFGAVDQSASYGIGANYTLPVQQADIGMLVSTGAQCVRVDIGYGPWLDGPSSTVSLIDSVVSSIRSDGKCLVIADASSETYRNGGAIPWEQFKQAWVQRVSTLAARYHPNYYVVIKEPGWYLPFVSDAKTNPLFSNATDWVGLTQNLTKAVLAASPGTKVGVAVAGDGFNGNKSAFYGQYVGLVQGVSGLSFIGVDIYGQTAINATRNYLAFNPIRLPIWIAETWSKPYATSSTQAQSDATWIQTVYQFGLSIHAKMLIPFYTDLFSGYTIPTATSALLTFFQGRTQAYTAFRNVVSGKG